MNIKAYGSWVIIKEVESPEKVGSIILIDDGSRLRCGEIVSAGKEAKIPDSSKFIYYEARRSDRKTFSKDGQEYQLVGEYSIVGYE